MLLRKRCRRGPRRLQLLLLLLMLGCLLLTVTVLHTPPQAPLQAGTDPAARHRLEAGFRLDFGESQEWVLEAEGQEYGPLEDLPPFLSLREDQLLVAMVSPWTRRNHSQGKRGGSYRFAKQPSGSQDKEAPVRDWGTEEASEVSEKEELTSHGLEEALSARIPLQRALPEVRHPLCVQQQPQGSLPTASIILCFHDEAWSTLLRTVHSILDTVPRAFLKEIILVDDLSRPGQLKSALSEYVAKLEGVKLLRSNKRLGAIRARMLGATRATGDVLVFMDSHCECHSGWLEPLLSRIADDRSRVVSPVIDVIDWKTFQYYPSRDLQRGVLDWKLDFHWAPLPEGERKALQSPIKPIRSPVVPSGVVAMDRHYFQNTGAYDPLMLLQGGENLELSLKAWLCGGSVEILPCSRVGHIYRNPGGSSPLDQEAALRNKVRIAEAWLGSFKDTFYRHNPEALSLSKAEKPDCTERLQLQRRLGCRMFSWFLAHIYPELYPSEGRPRFSGKLHNTGLGLCADCQAAGDILGCAVTLAPCNDSQQQQHLEHTGRQGIHFSSPQHLCFDVRQEQVILQPCTGEGPGIHQQLWDFQENGMIVHILSGKCMEAVEQENRRDLYLHQCDGKASQLWRFDKVHAVADR
ncbi:polypeptide N-acetylgalactosaminyltransferase 15 [Manis pentadactyla]|uniref:polypeptide N-acetylgalactosaminyltransferase 15 n=1 Tax=Manis pentadactyla TaxID=143292 RepID=UPI00255D0EAB|nr:polypeptide N-acetylgalactosaminyltransferase 15 [Manis pentadactyla]KAI5200460.1 Polypeptide N-Acetylgalactosaminyltransferase 15 [Manis pentadactyla]